MIAFTLIDGQEIFFLSLSEEDHHCKITISTSCTHAFSSIVTLSARRAADGHRVAALDVGELPVDMSKQRRESALSYQEALRQQV